MPTNKTHTALLIIDVQIGIFDGMRGCQWDEVVDRIFQLQLLAQLSATPVIHVQHSGPPGHRLDPAGPGWPIHPRIKPRPEKTIVHKRASDSFFETTLQQELAARSIDHLVVAGCMTQYCVDTTCRRAVSLGYDVTLVGDAHTTADTELLTAAQIIAHHNYTLDGFDAGGHSIVVKPLSDIGFVSTYDFPTG